MTLHLEHLDDETGNGGIILYEVPDTFDADSVYSTFCAGFLAAHPTASGRLTQRQRSTRDHQWIKHLDKQFTRVKHTTR
jgi:hypothetical protein